MPCVKLNGSKSMLIVTPKIPEDARMFDIEMLKDKNVHERRGARIVVRKFFLYSGAVPGVVGAPSSKAFRYSTAKGRQRVRPL